MLALFAGNTRKLFASKAAAASHKLKLKRPIGKTALIPRELSLAKDHFPPREANYNHQGMDPANYQSHYTYREELYAHRRFIVWNPEKPSAAFSEINDRLNQDGIRKIVIAKKRFIEPTRVRTALKIITRKRKFNRIVAAKINRIFKIHRDSQQQ